MQLFRNLAVQIIFSSWKLDFRRQNREYKPGPMQTLDPEIMAMAIIAGVSERLSAEIAIILASGAINLAYCLHTGLNN